MLELSESQIQKNIIEFLNMSGVLHWRNNTGRRGKVSYGCKGSPDIICVHGGRFIGIEVKDKKGKMSADQIEFRERLEHSGGIYILARDTDTVVDILYGLRR